MTLIALYIAGTFSAVAIYLITYATALGTYISNRTKWQTNIIEKSRDRVFARACALGLMWPYVLVRFIVGPLSREVSNVIRGK